MSGGASAVRSKKQHPREQTWNINRFSHLGRQQAFWGQSEQHGHVCKVGNVSDEIGVLHVFQARPWREVSTLVPAYHYALR